MDADSRANVHHPPDTSQVLGLWSELEGRFDRLKNWQQEYQQYLLCAQQSAVILAKQEAGLTQTRQRLEQRKARLHRYYQALRKQKKLLLEQVLLQQKQQLLQQQSIFKRTQNHLAAPALDPQVVGGAVSSDSQSASDSSSSSKKSSEKQVEKRIGSSKQELSAVIAEDRRQREAVVSRRLQRLKRCRLCLRERQDRLRREEAKAIACRQQYEGLLQERQTLLEVKDFLAQSEAHMIRRWAAMKAGGLAMGFLAIFALISVAAILVSQNFVYPTWLAVSSVSLGPDTSSSADANDSNSNLQTWALSQQQIILSEPVLHEALNQLAQRGIRPFDQTATMRTVLEKDLQIKSPGPGRLRLELRGTDRERIVLVLESLTRGLVTYQMTQDRQAGRTPAASIQESAARLPQPIEDPRRKVTAIIIGCGVGVGLLIWGIVFWRLLRVPRVLDLALEPSDDLLADAEGSQSESSRNKNSRSSIKRKMAQLTDASRWPKVPSGGESSSNLSQAQADAKSDPSGVRNSFKSSRDSFRSE